MSETTVGGRIIAAVVVGPAFIAAALFMVIACALLAVVGPFAVLFMDDPFGRHKKAQPEVTA